MGFEKPKRVIFFYFCEELWNLFSEKKKKKKLCLAADDFLFFVQQLCFFYFIKIFQSIVL